MINDLKLIKNKYGENMMHLCRECFPTILETPGLLFELLSSNFAYNKFLYDDIIKENKKQNFKNYIYSLINVEPKEIVVNKSPEELLDETGYILYECKTEKDIQRFKKYYYRNEKLCTFNGGRLNDCYVFFAIKKNVDEIRRENFISPERQDDYGVSVISIQFSKGEKNTVSIKNRYNHTVNNPDATFNNNLDNIIEGLTKSFETKYNLNITKRKGIDFELKNYVMANDGKYYKYLYEINNIYYCINNIIIDNYKVINQFQEKEKYIVFDYFILDLENKTIKLYDEKISDSFLSCFKNINKIEVKNERDSKNKIIYLYSDDKKAQIIKLNYKNQLVYYKNDYVYRIENNFLYHNKTLKEIEILNVVEIEKNFLRYNECLKNLSFPQIMKIGDNFCLMNKIIESLYFPKLESVGRDFLYCNSNLLKLNLPNLKIAGNSFLRLNLDLYELNLPNLMYVDNDFLYKNNKLLKLDLPSLISVYCDFMCENNSVNEINLPKLETVSAYFLQNNENLIKLNLARLKSVSCDFLKKAEVEILDLPNLEEAGSNFLYNNHLLKELNLPKIKLVGTDFLYNSCKYNKSLKHKIKDIIKSSKKYHNKILKLEKKKNGN